MGDFGVKLIKMSRCELVSSCRNSRAVSSLFNALGSKECGINLVGSCAQRYSDTVLECTASRVAMHALRRILNVFSESLRRNGSSSLIPV